MNEIARLFLRAKHWQIFLWIFGVFFVGHIAITNSFVAEGSAEDMRGAFPLFGLFMALFMYSFLGWVWSMGSFLASIVPTSLRLRMGFFRFALVYPPIHIFVFIAFLGGPNPSMFALIFPFYLFAMFCMFYNLYFVSKSLVLAETGKTASFYDYAGPFFLIWFFPIGIWIIQPRINRIYAQKGSAKPISSAKAG